MTGVIESCNLRFGGRTALVFEQYVVRMVGIERRVKIDQVNAFIWDILAKKIQVIAIKQDVAIEIRGSLLRLWHSPIDSIITPLTSVLSDAIQPQGSARKNSV